MIDLYTLYLEWVKFEMFEEIFANITVHFLLLAQRNQKLQMNQKCANLSLIKRFDLRQYLYVILYTVIS